MIEQNFLDDAVRQLRKLKDQSDKALAQTSDEHFFAMLDPEANSIALIMKHMAGNMRSRWTDFLTSDGEKPDRDRDREFEALAADSRALITARWEEGWACLFSAITPLVPNDLSKTVYIRGKIIRCSKRSIARCHIIRLTSGRSFCWPNTTPVRRGSR